jgi:hypothetical protein
LLVEYLKQADDPRKLSYVLYLIEQTRPPAETVVPALMDLLVKLDPIDDAPKHEPLFRALGSYGRDAEEAVPLLVGRWRALPASYRKATMVADIGRLGPAAVPFLCDVLRSPKKTIISAAFERLQVPIFGDLLRNQKKAHISAACDCLQRIGPQAKDAVEPLLQLLDDDEAQNRSIAKALAAIDPDGLLSRQVIARWASDPDQRVRERAANTEWHVRSIFGDPY